LAEDQEKFALSLLGGDTSSTPGPLAIVITCFGVVPAGAMIRRAGAEPGDLVFVSGVIGDAGGGLAVLKGEGSALAETNRAALIARYRTPTPRLALGRRCAASRRPRSTYRTGCSPISGTSPPSRRCA
jgi:thiamine-monophosphate kinase